MQLGIFSLFTRRQPGGKIRPYDACISDWLDEVKVADRLGFDIYWIAEHHFHEEAFESQPNPSLFAAYAASQTHRIRFGTAAYILPWHHPVRLAEDIALVDLYTRGRLEVGVARGYNPVEHDGLAAPRGGLGSLQAGLATSDEEEGNRKSFEEALQILLEAWSDRKLQYSPDRTIHRYPVRPDAQPIAVIPKPLQKPHPPLWMALYSKRSLEYAARHGLGIMLHNLSEPAIEDYIGTYQAVASEASGRQFRKGEKVCLVRDVYVAPTDAEARADVEEYMMEYVDFFTPFGFLAALTFPGEPQPKREEVTWDLLQERATIHGSPEYCARRLVETVRKFPVDVLTIHIHPPQHEKRVRCMELFAREVWPKVKSLVPAETS